MRTLTLMFVFVAFSLNAQTITLSADIKNAIAGSVQTNYKPSADLQLSVEWREKNVLVAFGIESFEQIKYSDVFVYVGTYTNNKLSLFVNAGYGMIIREYNNSYLTYDINTGLRYKIKKLEIGFISNYSPRPDIDKPVLSNYISIGYKNKK